MEAVVALVWALQGPLRGSGQLRLSGLCPGTPMPEASLANPGSQTPGTVSCGSGPQLEATEWPGAAGAERGPCWGGGRRQFTFDHLYTDSSVYS
jgi:hypothetical protein